MTPSKSLDDNLDGLDKIVQDLKDGDVDNSDKIWL